MYNSIKHSVYETFPLLTNNIRAIKHFISEKSFKPFIATKLYGKHNLSVIIEDRVAEQWYGRDINVPQEFVLLAGRGLNSGSLVFDLGAHQGVIAMMIAKEIGPAGKVIAVEASHRNAVLARRNAALNSIGNIEVLHAAVTRDGKPVLFTQRGNGSVTLRKKEFRAESVDGVAIDTLAETYGMPDLVYMDIEGFELEALKGAIKTLNSPASWLIEVHGDETIAQFGGCNRDVFAVFEKGFDLYSAIDSLSDTFLPLDRHGAVPSGRFFLAAIPNADHPSFSSSVN